MSGDNKIRTDFLKIVGNTNPKQDDLKKLELIPTNQLLKVIVADCQSKGVSLRMISIRYNVGISTVKNQLMSNKRMV